MPKSRSAHLRVASQLSSAGGGSLADGRELTLAAREKVMAIYHCSIKPISRSSGRSALAAAAYRAGERIADERTGEQYDYTRKAGVVHRELILPPGAAIERAELWNAAEKAEKRKDGRPAREVELALPAELSADRRQELAREFARHLSDRYGCAVDMAIHAPSKGGDQRNHHAHLLCTTRQITAQGLGAKTDLERADADLRAAKKPAGREQIGILRAAWAVMCNRALERQGLHRITNESHYSRHQAEPTKHAGPALTAMHRRTLAQEITDRAWQVSEEAERRKQIAAQETARLSGRGRADEREQLDRRDQEEAAFRAARAQEAAFWRQRERQQQPRAQDGQEIER